MGIFSQSINVVYWLLDFLTFGELVNNEEYILYLNVQREYLSRNRGVDPEDA